MHLGNILDDTERHQVVICHLCKQDTGGRHALLTYREPILGFLTTGTLCRDCGVKHDSPINRHFLSKLMLSGKIENASRLRKTDNIHSLEVASNGDTYIFEEHILDVVHDFSKDAHSGLRSATTKRFLDYQQSLISHWLCDPLGEIRLASRYVARDGKRPNKHIHIEPLSKVHFSYVTYDEPDMQDTPTYRKVVVHYHHKGLFFSKLIGRDWDEHQNVVSRLSDPNNVLDEAIVSAQDVYIPHYYYQFVYWNAEKVFVFDRDNNPFCTILI